MSIVVKRKKTKSGELFPILRQRKLSVFDYSFGRELGSKGSIVG